MILDKDTMVANALAHGGTPTAIDLGSTRPGPGEPFLMFITATSLAGCTGFTVQDSADNSSFATLFTQTCTSAELNAGPIEFRLPSDVRRYMKVILVGTTSAGTWTCAIVLPGNQTNK